MKRIISIFAAALICAAAYASGPAIRDIDIRVVLQRDGSARISERWDVTAVEGTEWYLVRSNLGDIKVEGLRVGDETGAVYVNEGEWDVDRSLRQKAGRCGIVTKRNGVEICWGLGSYGNHIYNVDYVMTNAVKSLEDYDMLHMQLVSPGLSSRPEHVKVSVSRAGAVIDTTSSRAWGFGYDGTVNFRDGAVVYESGGRFRENSSVISLIRFDKGWFESASVQNRTFDEVLDTAMDGAGFGDDDDAGKTAAIVAAIMAILSVALIIPVNRKAKKDVLGVMPKDVEWNRDVPFGGNMIYSDYTLGRLGVTRESNGLAAALTLKMIQNGALIVKKDEKERVEFYFNDDRSLSLDKVSKGLYDMMVAASGRDRILQEKEFSRWSRSNTKTVNAWVNSVKTSAEAGLMNDSLMGVRKYTELGQAEARKLVGLRKFLKDFTLINERGADEAALWTDYIAFAALLGIADKVAKQLRDINPQAFEEVMMCDYPTFNHILYRSNNLSRAIVNARAQEIARAGGGGSSSFGGGGGFSGGGVGGGCR